MSNLVFIDGDSISYLAAAKSELSVKEVLERVDSLVLTILSNTIAEEYIIFLSKRPYFRYVYNDQYKKNRISNINTIKFLRTASAYLRDKYNTYSMKGVEADDLCLHGAYQYNKLDNKIIVASPDKDVLGQNPFISYNYRNHRFYNYHERNVIRFIFLQVLMGDATDNIKGLSGYGIKKSTTIVNSVSNDLELSKFYKALEEIVLEHFIKKYKDAYKATLEYNKNYRQVYLIRKDHEYIREVGNAPQYKLQSVSELIK